MKDNLTYLFAAWLLAFCGLFFMFVRERSERIRLNDELTIQGSKIPVYEQANEEIAEKLTDCTVDMMAFRETAVLLRSHLENCDKDRRSVVTP